MIFQNRQGSNLNRKRLRIVSQTAEEIIADVERADNPTVEGTPIDATVMNQFQSEIDTANSNASTAVSTASTAASNAASALSTANAASQTASTAASTASDAKTKADYVETQLADRGATVKFNGVTQTEVNFDSDPQTQINSKLSIANVLSVTYPVGAIYLSVSSTDPGTIFGGTWEQIQDRFLLSAGTTYTAGATGGEPTHTLTTSEMPSHTHIQNAHSHGIHTSTNYSSNANGLTRDSWQDWVGGGYAGGTYSYAQTNRSGLNWIQSTTATNQNTGGGSAHNNMPPYLVVYMWKRTA